MTPPSLREIIADYLPDEAEKVSSATLDRAVKGVSAAGLGLAAMAALHHIDADESANLLVGEIRMWLRELIDSIT